MYNMGLCYYLLNNFDEALSYFQQAKQIKPDSQQTEQWIERVEKKQAGA